MKKQKYKCETNKEKHLLNEKSITFCLFLESCCLFLFNFNKFP